jgi:hypothetical protein
MQVNSRWFDLYDDDLEESLFEEFEEMLENDKKKELKEDNSTCNHTWKEVGKSPYTNEAWINCSKCDLRKEDYEYEQQHKKESLPDVPDSKSFDFWGV